VILYERAFLRVVSVIDRHSDAVSVYRSQTRNSSGDETANVNFIYNDIVHVLQSTAPSAPSPQTVQHGIVTVRTQKYQPKAKRQNIS